MKEFLIVKVGYWILQWGRLLSAMLGILTLGLYDYAYQLEGTYLNTVGKFYNDRSKP